MVFNWVKQFKRATDTLVPPAFMLPKSTGLLRPATPEQALQLTFYFRDTPQKLRLKILPHTELTIGRSSDKSDERPDIDFAPFGGADLGVSRRHAILERRKNRLVLLDLGSRNMTFVNGEQIQPYEVRILQSGDIISFGQLLTGIRY